MTPDTVQKVVIMHLYVSVQLLLFVKKFEYLQRFLVYYHILLVLGIHLEGHTIIIIIDSVYHNDKNCDLNA
ncbi:hypothetical protein BTR23_14275 [Alkalihalophilus pseudofirmus]|nr:hypothetical protein BTR23_14275 [Alkalihalophilus pseudofirmus]